MFRFTLIETDKFGRLVDDVPLPDPLTEATMAAYFKTWADSTKGKKEKKLPAVKILPKATAQRTRPVRKRSLLYLEGPKS